MKRSSLERWQKPILRVTKGQRPPRRAMTIQDGITRRNAACPVRVHEVVGAGLACAVRDSGHRDVRSSCGEDELPAKISALGARRNST